MCRPMCTRCRRRIQGQESRHDCRIHRCTCRVCRRFHHCNFLSFPNRLWTHTCHPSYRRRRHRRDIHDCCGSDSRPQYTSFWCTGLHPRTLHFAEDSRTRKPGYMSHSCNQHHHRMRAQNTGKRLQVNRDLLCTHCHRRNRAVFQIGNRQTHRTCH